MEHTLELQDEKEKAAKAAKESKLNRSITTKFLLSFTIPTILSFIVMGVFGTIDGVFAARGISQEALGAINFVMPFFTFTMAIGSMLSIGGSALIAKKKGKKLLREARENFTLITLVTLVTSIIVSVVSWFARIPLLRLLGANSGVFDLALEYLQPLILMMPFIMVGIVPVATDLSTVICTEKPRTNSILFASKLGRCFVAKTTVRSVKIKPIDVFKP